MPGYDSLSIPPFTSGSIYDALYSQYTRRCSAPLNGNTPDKIEEAISDSNCNILVYSGGGVFVVTGNKWADEGYSGPAAVIFIDNVMRINDDLKIGSSTGLVFVVRGHPDPFQYEGVEIKDTVARTDGVFITDKEFNTGGEICGSNGHDNNQLRIYGSVYGFGQLCFTRGLLNNRDIPAEQINYQAKYLWLFKDIIGDLEIVYREVAP